MVPEAKHREPLIMQPQIPDCILVFLICMLAAIDFNDYIPFETDKINNVPTNRLLSPEFHPVKSLASNMFPQKSFCIS